MQRVFSIHHLGVTTITQQSHKPDSIVSNNSIRMSFTYSIMSHDFRNTLKTPSKFRKIIDHTKSEMVTSLINDFCVILFARNNFCCFRFKNQNFQAYDRSVMMMKVNRSVHGKAAIICMRKLESINFSNSPVKK